MNEADAKHVVELYALIRGIDFDIARAKQAHTVKVEAWTNGHAESHRVTLELAESSIAVRDILVCELQALRRLRCQGLRRLGFDPPEMLS